MLRQQIDFALRNWKIGVHLALRTKRFGVNNRWWHPADSCMGVSTPQIIWDVIRIYPIFRNIQLMEFRARELHFMGDEEYELAFGRKKTDQPLTYKRV